MQLTLDTTNSIYQIRAYEPGRIQVNNDWFDHSIVVSPNEIVDPWSPTSLNDIKIGDFEAVLRLKPEVVLLGTGIKIYFPPSELLQPLYTQQIGVEIMDTGAACRTYNLLMSEGRRVIAALLIK